MQYFYEKKSEHYYYSVGAEFSKGKLLISDHKLGDCIKKSGDSDIEHYVIIEPKHVYRFVRACSDSVMHKKPKKDSPESEMIKILHGIFKIKNILKNNDIPYDFQVW